MVVTEINSNKTDNSVKNQQRFQGGALNWTLLLFISLCLNLILDNYLSFGIIKYPSEIIFTFLEFLKRTWINYVFIILSFVLQIYICYGVEKLLAREKLSETLGITLHLLNSLFVFNVIAVVFTKFIYSPTAGYWLAETFFMYVFKMLSYVFENQKYRLEKKHQNGTSKKNDDSIIRYPKNVTISNLTLFMLCSESLIYKIDGANKKEKNLKMACVVLIEIMLIHFTIAFLYYQYINPWVTEIIPFIDNGDYLRILQGCLKISIPVIIGWYLTYFFYVFNCIVPLAGYLFGTENTNLYMDWWNAENVTVFWRKWNYECHTILKNIIYLPAKEYGYSLRLAPYAVGLLSGILHEYLLTIPLRGLYGFPTIIMLLQTPAGDITMFVQKHIGVKYSNLLISLTIIIGQTSYIVAACYTAAKLNNYY